jgi:hypothetical protein
LALKMRVSWLRRAITQCCSSAFQP